MFEAADNIADFFRGFLPLLFCALPVLIICSANPVLASSEFSVQRMSQFDVNGAAYGCRSSAISFEAKSLYTWKTARHCVVAKMEDLTVEQFREIRQKAGGLIVLLPRNVSQMSVVEKEHLTLLEQAMLEQSCPIPVYFSAYNADLEKVIEDITVMSAAQHEEASDRGSNAQKSSAVSELFNAISANGYQIIVTGGSHAPSKNSRIPLIQGELVPVVLSKAPLNATNAEGSTPNAGHVNVNANKELPIIILTAHLKTFGLYNEYPLNVDAAILMTVMELFSKLYNSPSTAPKYRLIFLLSESGAILNFQGAKKWLDDNSQMQNVDFVMCLDTAVKALKVNTEHGDDSVDSDGFYMHVSKPPKEGTAAHQFYKILKATGSLIGNKKVESVHKKINLADLQMAWEHERFSIKRFTSFTLSALNSPREALRNTIFRDDEEDILAEAQQNAQIIVESLARYIYKVKTDGDDDSDKAEAAAVIFADAMSINRRLVKSYLHLKSALKNNDLKNAFEKYLKDVRVIYEKSEPRDPEFMLYDGQEATANVYRVKPAVFDLLLTILICIYLAVVYVIIQYCPHLYDLICRMAKYHGGAPSNGYAGVSANNSYPHHYHSSEHQQRSKAKMY